MTPGVPLLSLVDLADTWLRFSLREDLIAGLKVGDRFIKPWQPWFSCWCAICRPA